MVDCSTVRIFLVRSGFAARRGSGSSTSSGGVLARQVSQRTAVSPDIQARGSDVTISTRYLNDPTASRYGLRVMLVTVSPSSYSLTVDDIRRSGQPSAIFAAVERPGSDLVLVNGAFFGTDDGQRFYPLGLLINGSKRLNVIKNWKSGGVLFCTRDLPARIAPISAFAESRDIVEAVQSKPILVENSRNGIRAENHEWANRTAVALRNENTLIVAGAFAPGNKAISLYEFAEILCRPLSEGGAAAEWALNMDGGPGAHISVPAAHLQLGSEGSTFVTNIIRLSVRR